MEKTDNLTLTICSGLIFGKVAGTIFRRAHARAGVKSVFYNSFIPYDPKSEKQLSCRNVFAQGMTEWRGLSEPEKEIYRVAVKRLPMHGVNLFLKFFLAEQRKNAELLLVADWQRVLQQKALQWATARVCERELMFARFGRFRLETTHYNRLGEAIFSWIDVPPTKKLQTQIKLISALPTGCQSSAVIQQKNCRSFAKELELFDYFLQKEHHQLRKRKHQHLKKKTKSLTIFCKKNITSSAKENINI